MLDSSNRDERLRARRLIGLLGFLVLLAAVISLRETGVLPGGEETGSTSTTAVSVPNVEVITIPNGQGDDRPVASTADDDERILSEGPLPPVARVDYSAFPRDVDPSSPSGTSFYVSPQGDDGAPGTLAQPLLTIERALSLAGDGDRVAIRAGTYATAGLVVTQSRFTLEAYRGEPVVVVPHGSNPGYGLTISEPGQHDVAVRGLVLDGFPELGIHWGNPVPVRNLILTDLEVRGSTDGMAGYYYPTETIIDGLLLEHVTLRDIGATGLQFGAGAGRNVRMVGLHVRMTNRSSGDPSANALLFESGDNILMEGSIIEEAGGAGIDLKATRAALVNTVVRHVAGSGINLRYGGDVINCLVFDTGADAQLVAKAGSFRILNSTFAYHGSSGNRSYAAIFGGDTPAEPVDVTIANSVFFREPGPLLFSVGANVTLAANLFFDFPDRIVTWGDSSWGATDVATGLGRGNLVEDPRFADPLLGDFHPGVGSPLFGRGAFESGAPSFDLLLAPRSESVTIGALQTTAVTGEGPATTTTTLGPANGPEAATVFSDVQAGDAYAAAIEGLAARGVVRGYPRADGGAEYHPEAPVWRAQFTKMIVRALRLTVSEGMTSPFIDLGPDDRASLYPHEYVAAAAAAGITRGVTPRIFSPYGEISRAQLLTMVVRAAREAAPGAISAPPAGYSGSLGDFDPVHGPAAAAAEYAGLTDGLHGFGPEWNPWDSAGRGEVAQVLWNLVRAVQAGGIR